VPDATAYDHEAAAPHAHGFHATRLLEQQLDVAVQYVDEFVRFGVNFPVRPVTLAGVFGHEPAASELLELSGRLRPELFAAVDDRGGTVAAEQDVFEGRVDGLRGHGPTPSGTTLAVR